jgi:hypothetical protein
MKAKKYYLYIKESPLGLKYLGKTSKDPFKYKGSGKIWLLHLRKHKISYKDIKTEILLETYDEKQIVESGIYYSGLYNIVELKEWANLIIEKGDGGDTSKFIDYSKINKDYNKITNNENYIKTRTNKQLITPKSIKKALATRRRNGYDVSKMRKAFENIKVECKYCRKICDIGNITRWHQENCKYKSEKN